jgi:two-component system sensor histidine kinase UhpB
MREGNLGVASPPAASVRSRARTRQAAVEEDVRRLVARELHDRVAQTLTGMLIDLENFKTEQVGWSDVLRQLDTIQDSTRLVLSNLRQLLHDLRGEEAVGDGFVTAVGALVARFEEKTSISAQLTVLPGWPDVINQPASVNIYRIIEEALANVKMHSGAREVRIVLQQDSDNELSVVIGDDGRGLDTDESRTLGFGTVGMKERAVLLGGRLRIESEAGDGTTVRAIFPKQLLTNPRPANELEPKEIHV